MFDSQKVVTMFDGQKVWNSEGKSQEKKKSKINK